MRQLERFFLLQVIDAHWREHLDSMDYLREGIHLRSMAQKDPLVEYRVEGHGMFEEMMARRPRGGRLDALPRRGDRRRTPSSSTTSPSSLIYDDGGSRDLRRRGLVDVDAHAGAAAGGSSSTTAQSVEQRPQAIGRNDPCPCGSGKKYKRCHGRGRLDAHAERAAKPLPRS